MPKRKKARKSSKILLDAGSAKRPRGRPGINQSEIVGRARNYRRMFWSLRLDKKRKEYVRDKPYEWAVTLVDSKTDDEVMRALDSAPDHIQREFKPLAALMLQVLQERDFPKRQENQFDFLADSLAARGEVSPRRSRDICQEERLKAKRAHHIISYEFKIECSCGFKGFSKDHGCPKCKATIEFGIDSLFGRGLF